MKQQININEDLPPQIKKNLAKVMIDMIDRRELWNYY